MATRVSSLKATLTLEDQQFLKEIEKASRAFSELANRARIGAASVVASLDKMTAAAAKAASAVASANASIASTVQKTSNSVQSANTQIASSAGQTATATSNAAAKINNSLNQISSSSGNASKTFAQNMQSMAANLATVGRNMTIGITGPVALVAKQAIKASGDFEESMNVLQATSGASAAEMKKVGTVARALGQDLSLPATDAVTATDAILTMVRSGISLTDAMAAAKPVLQFSAAAQISNADAALIAADAMNQFKIKSSDVAAVTDILTNAQNKGAGDAKSFAEALKQSAATSGALNISFGDTATSLALLGKEMGVRGSAAGTDFANAMQSLLGKSRQSKDALTVLGATFKDSNGNFVGLSKAADILKEKLGALSPASRAAFERMIGGQRAMKTIELLAREGSVGFNKMREAMSKTGTAADISAARMKGINGAIDAMKSSITTALVDAVTPYLGAIKNLGLRIADLINSFSKLSPAQKDQIIKFSLIAAAAGPVIFVFSRVIAVTVSLYKTFQIVKGVMAGIQFASFAAKAVGAFAKIRTGFMAVSLAAQISKTAVLISMGGIVLTVGLVAAAVAALTSIWVANVGHIQEVTAAMWTTLVQIFSSGADTVGKIWQGVIELMTARTFTGIQKIVEGSKAIVSKFGDNLQGEIIKREAQDLKDQNRLVEEVKAAAAKKKAAKLQAIKDEQDIVNRIKSMQRAMMTPMSKQGKDIDPFAAVDNLRKKRKEDRKPKKSPRELQEIAFTKQLSSARSELAAVTSGEDNETGKLIGRFNLLDPVRVRELARIKEEIKTQRDLTQAKQQYGEEIKILEMSVQMFQAGENKGLIELKKQYPLLTLAQLRYKQSLQEVEKKHIEAADAAQAVRNSVSSMLTSIVKASAVTKEHKAAVELFAESIRKEHPEIRTSTELWNLLTAAQKEQAVTQAEASRKAGIASILPTLTEAIQNQRRELNKWTANSEIAVVASELFGSVLESNVPILAQLTPEMERQIELYIENKRVVLDAQSATQHYLDTLERYPEALRNAKKSNIDAAAALEVFRSGNLEAIFALETHGIVLNQATEEQKAGIRTQFGFANATKVTAIEVEHLKEQFDNQMTAGARMTISLEKTQAMFDALADTSGLSVFALEQTGVAFGKLDDKTKILVRSQFELEKGIATRNITMNASKDAAANIANANALATISINEQSTALANLVSGNQIAIFAWEKYKVRLQDVNAETATAIKRDFQITKQIEKIKAVSEAFSGAFESAFKDLTHGFKSFAQSMIKGVEDMLVQIAAKFLAAKLTESLFGATGGGGGLFGMLGGLIGGGDASLKGASGIGGLFGKALGGGIAGGGGGGLGPGGSSLLSDSFFTNGGGIPKFGSGGDASRGRAYIVGDKGPELFVPRESGRVVPNGQFGGVTNHITIMAKDADSFRKSRSTVQADITVMTQNAQRRNG